MGPINKKNGLQSFLVAISLFVFLLTFFELVYFYVDSSNKTVTIESQAEIILDYYERLEECR